jgi:hypothetical protein
VLATYFKSVLNASALVLGIVNGLFLLKFYVRDRPKLMVMPVGSDSYQWWFRMPGGHHDGSETRRYGFLVYIDVSNRGLRKTELDSWWLCIKTEGHGKHLMNPQSMPEPTAKMGELVKYYRVLGQKGLVFDGSTLTEPGCSISGMAFFAYECYGDESWNPAFRDGILTAEFTVKSVFGRSSRCELKLSEKSLDEVKAMAPGIHMTSKRKKNESPDI